MSRKIITTAGESPAILLPKEYLEKMGIDIGDEIDMSIKGRTLILRPLDNSERAQKIDAATKEVFKRRKSAYEKLARELE